MKATSKIIIGIVCILCLFIIGSLFFMTAGVGPPESALPQTDGPIVPEPVDPTPPVKGNGDGEPHQSAVDRIISKMDFANIAFNAPEKINIDDSPQIQLVLSLSEAIDALKRSITDEGRRIGSTIKVSDMMEARLTGYMFQITAITPEVQAVSRNERTEWRWEVHPKEEGRHDLHLTLTALLNVDGVRAPRTIRTFDKEIEVFVTGQQKAGSFFKENWQWLWAAIILPIAGWIWKRRKVQPAKLD